MKPAILYLGQSRVRVDRDIPKCAHGRERHLLKMPLIWRVDCIWLDSQYDNFSYSCVGSV
jgi:hypothetical protein